jgi:hypothetical protein
MRPQDALSPRNKIEADSLDVIYTAPGGGWSLAEVVWDGEARVGCRWNGDINDPEDKGNPRSHNQGTWFVLPDEIGFPIAMMVRTFRDAYDMPADHDRLQVMLKPAPEDPAAEDEQYQRELKDFSDALKGQGVTASPRLLFRDSIADHATFLGDFLITLAWTVPPALATIIVKWISARAGRKVRVMFGNVDVTGGNADEVREILDHVTRLKQTARRNDDA